MRGEHPYHYLTTPSQTGYIRSLTIGVGLVIIAAFILLFGVLADLVRVNRMLLEDVRYTLRRDAPRRGSTIVGWSATLRASKLRL